MTPFILDSVGYFTWSIIDYKRRKGLLDMITKTYFSAFQNIFQNLCLEDYFLRETDEEFILFYTNTPCVVMGNFQNPWKETSPSLLSENEVALARRQSGGGTVFHDEGNLNFCIFRNKPLLSETDKADHLELIQSFLRQKGVVTEKLSKSGMIFLKDKVKYKFSGEAFKQTSARSFHHGTLLISSQLDLLKKFLTPVLPEIKTKAIASNPHKVGNLADVIEGLTPLKFYQEFQAYHQLLPLDVDFGAIHQYILEKAHHLAGAEVVLKKTPEFILRQNEIELTVRRGQVVLENGVEVRERDFSEREI
ncbi:MAG: lipoyltransferase/lipoate-protein ligase [Bacteriovoracaceae bacterium]